MSNATPNATLLSITSRSVPIPTNTHQYPPIPHQYPLQNGHQYPSNTPAKTPRIVRNPSARPQTGPTWIPRISLEDDFYFFSD